MQKFSSGNGTAGLIVGENSGVFGALVIADPVVDAETGVAGVVEA